MAIQELRFYTHHLKQIYLHVSTSPQREVCGIVSGINGISSNVYKITNVSRISTKFLMSPNVLLEILLHLEKIGHQILAFYHSHPYGPATPSSYDIHEYHYSEVINLIWAHLNNEWVYKAYIYTNDNFEEVQIKLISI